MAVRKVAIYPDPVLKHPARNCDPTDPKVLEICQDLVDTMSSYERCVGLAAPQIGESIRVLAMDVSAHPRGAEANHGPVVLINPEVHSSAGKQIGREGCLSLPEITANVARATRVWFSAATPEGSRLESMTSGFEARALLHELDHLDGILILDRVASPSEVFQRQNPS